MPKINEDMIAFKVS